jgi:ornithine carbamoyltransferase
MSKLSESPPPVSERRPGTRTDHYLRVGDLDARQLSHLLDLAAKMREDPHPFENQLHGESVACYFEKPSTRTRVSFEAAAHRLGMLPIMLRPDELQLGRGEPIEDTARALSSYCAAIVARVFSQRVVEQLAAASSAPVINALSDDHHPCQALADLLTLHDTFGHLAGLHVAYLGDATNVAQSLMEAGALAGMHIKIGSPARYQPLLEITAAVTEVARAHGGSLLVTDDPFEAADDVDAVYTDVWVSMGDEAEQHRRLRDLTPFAVTVNVMRHAKPHAVFMHCLPARRGQEVAAEVIDSPRSLVFDQAANRLPTDQTVLWALCSGNWPQPEGRSDEAV